MGKNNERDEKYFEPDVHKACGHFNKKIIQIFRHSLNNFLPTTKIGKLNFSSLLFIFLFLVFLPSQLQLFFLWLSANYRIQFPGTVWLITNFLADNFPWWIGFVFLKKVCECGEGGEESKFILPGCFSGEFSRLRSLSSKGWLKLGKKYCLVWGKFIWWWDC